MWAYALDRKPLSPLGLSKINNGWKLPVLRLNFAARLESKYRSAAALRKHRGTSFSMEDDGPQWRTEFVLAQPRLPNGGEELQRYLPQVLGSAQQAQAPTAYALLPINVDRLSEHDQAGESQESERSRKAEVLPLGSLSNTSDDTTMDLSASEDSIVTQEKTRQAMRNVYNVTSPKQRKYLPLRETQPVRRTPAVVSSAHRDGSLLWDEEALQARENQAVQLMWNRVEKAAKARGRWEIISPSLQLVYGAPRPTRPMTARSISATPRLRPSSARSVSEARSSFHTALDTSTGLEPGRGPARTNLDHPIVLASGARAAGRHRRPSTAGERISQHLAQIDGSSSRRSPYLLLPDPTNPLNAQPKPPSRAFKRPHSARSQPRPKLGLHEGTTRKDIAKRPQSARVGRRNTETLDDLGESANSGDSSESSSGGSPEGVLRGSDGEQQEAKQASPRTPGGNRANESRAGDRDPAETGLPPGALVDANKAGGVEGAPIVEVRPTRESLPAKFQISPGAAGSSEGGARDAQTHKGDGVQTDRSAALKSVDNDAAGAGEGTAARDAAAVDLHVGLEAEGSAASGGGGGGVHSESVQGETHDVNIQQPGDGERALADGKLAGDRAGVDMLPVEEKAAGSARWKQMRFMNKVSYAKSLSSVCWCSRCAILACTSLVPLLLLTWVALVVTFGRGRYLTR